MKECFSAAQVLITLRSIAEAPQKNILSRKQFAAADRGEIRRVGQIDLRRNGFRYVVWEGTSKRKKISI